MYNCLLAWKLIGWMVLIKSCSFKVLAVAPIIWRPVQQLKPVKETIDKEVWRICRKWTSITLSVCFAFWTFGFEGTNYLISKSFRYVVVFTAHDDEEDGSQKPPIHVMSKTCQLLASPGTCVDYSDSALYVLHTIRSRWNWMQRIGSMWCNQSS